MTACQNFSHSLSCILLKINQLFKASSLHGLWKDKMFHCNSVSILETKMIDGTFINNSSLPQYKFEENRDY